MQRNITTTTTAAAAHHHQACAACKHQRKKCTDKCILAPFFPAEKAREFQAVHKVFGVSNVQKIVRGLVAEEDRRRAADSLVWEAFCRQRDPVLGPYGEYRKVYDELKMYKTAGHRQHQVGHGGGLVYKAAAGGGGLVGWSVGGGGGGSSGTFGYGSGYEHLKGQDHHHHHKERESVGCVLSTNLQIHHPQQHLINGFNQQYYLSGQLSPLDAKSIESSIWEDTGS